MHVDLTYLERLFKGDRSRMEQWVRIYLEDAPGQYSALEECVQRNDAQGLAATAHELRPHAHYLGAKRLLELLEHVGNEARASGATACAATVDELVALGSAIEAELRSHFAIT
ncbi:MAG: Hpt domain-containing protein [Flavobacteriales bacterium]|nr:Hpt domain-containing protein [Flavobacteriales bacterium]